MTSRAWRHPHNAPRGVVGRANGTRSSFASSRAFVRRDRGHTVEPFVEALFGTAGPSPLALVGSSAGSSSAAGSLTLRSFTSGTSAGTSGTSGALSLAAFLVGASSGSSSASGVLSLVLVTGPVELPLVGEAFGSCLVRGTLRVERERQIIASFSTEAPMALRRRQIQVSSSGRRIDHSPGSDGGAWAWTSRMLPSVMLALRTTKRRARVFRELGTDPIPGKLITSTAREVEAAYLEGLAPLISAGRIWDVTVQASIAGSGLSVAVSYRDAVGPDTITI